MGIQCRAIPHQTMLIACPPLEVTDCFWLRTTGVGGFKPGCDPPPGLVFFVTFFTQGPAPGGLGYRCGSNPKLPVQSKIFQYYGKLRALNFCPLSLEICQSAGQKYGKNEI
eukprot:EG_transcript_27317